jgi:hypothetical protein
MRLRGAARQGLTVQRPSAVVHSMWDAVVGEVPAHTQPCLASADDDHWMMVHFRMSSRQLRRCAADKSMTTAY